jgi:hypothetical protein
VFLPPSTNAQYRGARASVAVLAVFALGALIPGLIHSFLPDGGSQAIAHLDLGDRRDLVIGVFAWEGATQLTLALAMGMVVWRYRTLTPLQGWVLRPPASGQHPPEHYASPVVVAVAAAFLVLSLRERSK